MNSNSILVLCGSPRGNGTTARFLAALQEACNDVTIINSYTRGISPCTDCRACQTGPGCVIRDMDDIYQALESSGMLVIASPIYNGGLPAPLKCVIDRFQPYYHSRISRNEPRIRAKTGFLFLCSGQDEQQAAEYIQNRLNRLGTVINTRFDEILYISDTDTKSTAGEFAGFIRKIKEV